tara:strand:+ start:492 stop:782 length:291 start_codon:yes stop_codon:yes gene_type:complete
LLSNIFLRKQESHNRQKNILQVSRVSAEKNILRAIKKKSAGIGITIGKKQKLTRKDIPQISRGDAEKNILRTIKKKSADIGVISGKKQKLTRKDIP